MKDKYFIGCDCAKEGRDRQVETICVTKQDGDGKLEVVYDSHKVGPVPEGALDHKFRQEVERIKAYYNAQDVEKPQRYRRIGQSYNTAYMAMQMDKQLVFLPEFLKESPKGCSAEEFALLYGGGTKDSKAATEYIDPTLCRKCGKPHGLRDEDAGSIREEARVCIDCFGKKD